MDWFYEFGEYLLIGCGVLVAIVILVSVLDRHPHKKGDKTDSDHSDAG